jgi:hypothetical protein
MPRCRKSHLLLFLVLLVIAQSFFAPMGSPADCPLLPRNLFDGPNVDNSRLTRQQSSGDDGNIVGVRNIGLNSFAKEGHAQPLFEFGTPPSGKRHLGKSLPSSHRLPVAQNIMGRSSLEATIITPTTPLVLLSEFLTMTTLIDKIVYLLFVLCYSLCIFSWLTRKHPDI